VTERNAALRFLAPSQVIELAPADAERLGIDHGEQVWVRSNGTSVSARAAVRARMRPGAAFLIEGIAEQGANLLGGAETVEVTRISRDPGTPAGIRASSDHPSTSAPSEEVGGR